MLRIGNHCRNGCKNYVKSRIKYQNTRSLATSTSGGAGRSLLLAGGVVAVGGAATVGLAWQRPEFRRTMEDYIPASHYVFDPILGPSNVVSTPTATHKPSQTDPFESSLRKVRKAADPPKEEKSEKVLKQKEDDAVSERTQEENLSQETEMTREETAVESSEKTIEPEIPLQSQELQSVVIDPPVLETETNVHNELLEDIGTKPDQTGPDPVTVQISETQEQHSEEKAEDKLEDSTEPISPEIPQTELTNQAVERSPEEVEASLFKLEEEVLADAAATSAILSDALAKSAERCLEAIDSNKEAAEAISLHTALLKNAMDQKQNSSEQKESQWSDMSRVLEQKSRLQSEAESTYQHAREELTKLKSIIAQAKKTNNPEVNSKIIEAEENYTEMMKEMEDARAEVNTKLSESHVMSQYKDLIEEAKEQFRNELLSVMPDVKLESGWRSLSQKMSQDDLNALIAHAHRRVDQLQRELAEERAISTRRMELAVQAARERWNTEKENEISAKMEMLKEEAEFEHDKKMEEARVAFENEMLTQLKRQAAAHSDHLADMLGIQEKQIKEDMEQEFQNRLNEQQIEFVAKMQEVKTNYETDISNLTEKFQFDLNKALAKVSGIESAIDGRAHIENESRKAQELWLACEALRIALEYGDNGKPVPLKSELESIVQVHGAENGFREIANTFPQEASKRGVFTEESLRISYKQVSKMCRRLSLISEARNSLFMYFLSYLKSFLIISHAQNEPPSDLNIEELDTFQILSYATYCLEHGDLEQTTRFLNQLKGEPKRIAEGWLKEARLLLETKQTVQALSSLASAFSIAANLEM